MCDFSEWGERLTRTTLNNRFGRNAYTFAGGIGLHSVVRADPAVLLNLTFPQGSAPVQVQVSCYGHRTC